MTLTATIQEFERKQSIYRINRIIPLLQEQDDSRNHMHEYSFCYNIALTLEIFFNVFSKLYCINFVYDYVIIKDGLFAFGYIYFNCTRVVIRWFIHIN
jgi:hypothetical protein